MSETADSNTWQSMEPYLHVVLNEVLHGFSVDYAKQLGTTPAELTGLFDKVHNVTSEQMLLPKEAGLLGRIAQLCDEELGTDEFQTRTGYTLEESQQMQAQLERLASAPLHAVAS